jgi:hypothetical protein
MFNPYLYDKLAQSHHQELLQEAEQQRMLSQLPRRHPQLMQKVTRSLAGVVLNITISVKKVKLSTRSATGQL